MSDLRLGSTIEYIDQIPDLVAGEDLQPGFVALDANGEVVMANAGVNYDQAAPTIGFAPFAASSGDAVMVVCEGLVFGASDLTAGEPVYLSATTDGDVQASAPSTSGDIVQVVGQAISADRFVIRIDPVYVTAS